MKLQRQRSYPHLTTLLSAGILGLIVLAVTLGPLLYPVSAQAIDFSQSGLPPSWQHPFGTND
ncbi:MAG: ABC transporter permease, partial [Leptolyngbya sp. SIO4C1]|nr:ABC transporter permease [Leptolyngbya sp. SIO4C1]